MSERLGVGIIPGTGWRAAEIQDVARAAEEAGFEAIFCTEVNNDSMATAQLMGFATRHIKVGTWVADIYLRVPYLCAKSAIIAADATGGRFILGLGVSHQPVNRALGIDMPDPMEALRKYSLEVADWLRGEGPGDSSAATTLSPPGADLLRGVDLTERRARWRNRRWRDAAVVVSRARRAQPTLDRAWAQQIRRA